MNNQYQQLSDRLDQLVIKAVAHLRGWSLRQNVHIIIEQALILLLIVPVGWLLLNSVAMINGKIIWAPDIVTVILYSLLLPFIYVVIKLLWVYFDSSIDRQKALALYDQQLGLKDRLVTADEFIHNNFSATENTAFVAAAIDDANNYVGQAQKFELTPIKGSLQSINPHKIIYLPLALLLLFFASWLQRVSLPSDNKITIASTNNVNIENLLAVQLPANQPNPLVESKAENNQSNPPNDNLSVSTTAKTPVFDTAGNDKNTQSSSGQSQASSFSASSDSNSSSNGSSAEGKKQKPSLNPSSQDEQYQQASTSASEQKNPTQSKSKNNTAQSAGTAGKGDSNQSKSGANENSGENQSSSAKKDKQSSENKSNNDSDNKSSNNKSSSKSSTSKNQSKQSASSAAQAAASTSSSQKQQKGKGAGKNPGNGQSSGGQPGKGQSTGKQGLKKSRGVASMILGVPMEDKIKGTANQGRSKKTQQKSKPSQQSVTTVTAQDRTTRVNPIGYIEHPELSAPMKAIVRDYFIELRTKTNSQEK